ncbi:hypothetical protein BH23PAT1_BH23PAT1_2200 [soil metagenome]
MLNIRSRLKALSAGWGQYAPRIKQFVNEYSLPLAASVVFVLMVFTVAHLRVSRQSSLADLLIEVSDARNEHDVLISKDKAAELKRHNEEDRQEADPAGDGTTSFAINTNTSRSPSTGGATPQPRVFGTAIDYFRRTSTELECTTPKPKPQTCSKRYIFVAGVRASNGPGTIRYGWLSNIDGASEDGSISAGGGNTLVLMQKSITLTCKTPSNFNLRLLIHSPISTQSAPINVSHNCNEL